MKNSDNKFGLTAKLEKEAKELIESDSKFESLFNKLHAVVEDITPEKKEELKKEITL